MVNRVFYRFHSPGLRPNYGKMSVLELIYRGLIAGMDCRSVVQKLRRAVGSEGQELLISFNLLQPLVKQMLIYGAIAGVVVSKEELQDAQTCFLRQRGYERMEQWTELLETLRLREHDVLERLRHDIRRRNLIRERYAAKAEARFLERKNDLDQVLYSLLRLKNSFLAQELYLQIESGETNFADLARRYAEGPERSTNGIVGPFSLTQAHPALVEKLRVAQPGVLLEPFRISDWWLVVRLERYSPATFTDEVAEQMCQEMFDAWIDEETTKTLALLTSEMKEPVTTSDFSDFSISR